MADRRVSKDVAQSAVKDKEQTQLIKQLVEVAREQRKQLRREFVPAKATKRFADVILEWNRKVKQSAGEVDVVDDLRKEMNWANVEKNGPERGEQREWLKKEETLQDLRTRQLGGRLRVWSCERDVLRRDQGCENT